MTGIHFLLTYTCNFECDHCFLYCSPRAQGTLAIGQITEVLEDAEKIGTVEWIFYEGGEPFLYFPLLVEGIKRARSKGFKVGVVTNAYGANSHEDAELWLKPLAAAGVSHLSISNDRFHYGEERKNPAAMAHTVAKRLGLDTSSICIDPPKVVGRADAECRGVPVVDGGAKFRGRAVEKLSGSLPLRTWETLHECPDEDLASPSRVHVDCFGNVQICQGMSIGNMCTSSLSDIIDSYEGQTHPICGPLLRGGPAELARAMDVEPEAGYVDECHLCYLTRLASIDKYPHYLAPAQVYGL